MYATTSHEALLDQYVPGIYSSGETDIRMWSCSAFRYCPNYRVGMHVLSQDADDWIRDVNYSSDGSRLAVASNDCKIYVYATRDGFAKLSTIACHQSFVTHVDFSADGSYIQSADGARSLLFADAATGIQIPSELRQKTPDTNVCCLPA